jgi:hypothetical protein
MVVLLYFLDLLVLAGDESIFAKALVLHSGQMLWLTGSSMD